MAIPVRIRQPAPLAGLRTAWPEDDLDPRHAPYALNVRFRFGEVRQAPGRSLISGPVAAEDALAIVRFPLTDGTTEWSVLATETGLFRWGSTAPGVTRQWHRVTGSGLTGADRYSIAAGEDYLFLARLGHEIMRWDGGAATSYGAIPDATTFPGSGAPRSRFVEYFNDRLVLGWTVEDGTTYANRVRWAVNADHTDWSGDGSGYLDLYDGNAIPITGLKGLGGRCAIYHPDAIRDLVPTGELDPEFVIETRIRGMGTRAPYTICSTGQTHFFLGTDCNVYAWDGTQLRPVGEPILDTLQAFASPTKMATYFGAVSTVRGEYWLVLGSGNVFIYDYQRDAWSRDSFSDITALGEVVDTTSAVTWDTVTGTWAAQSRQWWQMGGDASTVLWAGRTDGATFAVDETVNYDYFAVGSIVDRICETRDWYGPAEANGEPDPTRQWTLQRVLLTYDYVSASPFEFGVSTDRGTTWTTKQITPSTSGYSWVDLNLTGHVWRFRFRENDATGAFRWRSYVYEFVPGGSYLG